MLRVSRWFDRGPSGSDQGHLDVANESQNLQKALVAVELILNDDIAGAEGQLAGGTSAFHKLATGTLSFLKATMGFEQENMKEASDLLAEAENSAYSFHQKALSNTNVSASAIYGRGSEFALCQAQAQIMNAIVGILNESLTESIKGFYKMRKAYLTLDNLAQMEMAFVKTHELQKLKVTNASRDSFASARSVTSRTGTVPAHSSGLRHAESVNGVNVGSESSSGNLPAPFVPKMDPNFLKDPTPLPSGATTPVLQAGVVLPTSEGPLVNSFGLLNADANSAVFSTPIDIFIHSGVNLMSGIINLLLSVIPPSFGRLLSIVGFRGQRERGLQMLWQAAKFPNINGGMAALILFVWYNGIIGFCDIITDSDPNSPEDVNGIPTARLQALLKVMRVRYPGSLMWKLEEARSYAVRRQISKSLEILNQPHETQMKQLIALHAFEKALDYQNSHQYELCAKTFLECIDLNGWSPALYCYSAGSAYLQLYRNSKLGSDHQTTEKYGTLAEKYLKEAPTCIAKRRMMGRPLPLDTFVARKITKWTARSKAWNCSFIDAAGVAPLDELIIVWNGFKKMDEAQLNESMKNLSWLAEHSEFWKNEDDNEKAITTVLKATILRHLRRHEESMALLRENVLSYDASAFRGGNHDNWVGPTANYEMATNYWMQRKEYNDRYGAGITGIENDNGIMPELDLEHDGALVREAKKYIEIAKNWGGYDLDTRLGMKVTAAHGAILRWEARHKDLAQH